jgi:hypothetical protein
MLNMSGSTEAGNNNAAELCCGMNCNTPHPSKAAPAAAMADTTTCQSSVNQFVVPESTCSHQQCDVGYICVVLPFSLHVCRLSSRRVLHASACKWALHQCATSAGHRPRPGPLVESATIGITTRPLYRNGGVYRTIRRWNLVAQERHVGQRRMRTLLANICNRHNSFELEWCCPIKF